jgi:hypothetical protein
MLYIINHQPTKFCNGPLQALQNWSQREPLLMLSASRAGDARL